MRAGLAGVLLLLAAQAGAQSFVTMGRLFTTPGERAQLDAQRNQALQGVPAAPGSAGAAGVPAGAGAPGMEASAGCAPGSAPGCPPAAPGTGIPLQPGAVPDAGSAQAEAQQAPGLRLDGVIRRNGSSGGGSGRTMVIVNGEVQPAPAGGVSRGTVTLRADGRAVALKPGQRYDPATGEIHESAR